MSFRPKVKCLPSVIGGQFAARVMSRNGNSNEIYSSRNGTGSWRWESKEKDGEKKREREKKSHCAEMFSWRLKWKNSDLGDAEVG